MTDDPVGEALALTRTLSAGVIAAVFARYGRPLAVELPESNERVTLSNGAVVRCVLLRTPLDVIANHWFILEHPGAETVGIPGPLFAAALAALSRSELGE
jgi:hypothetical protein